MDTKQNGHSLYKSRTSWRRVAAVVLADVAVLTVMLLAFAWPATDTSPRDVPLVVAGPSPAVQELQARLDTAQPGAFDLTAVADEQAARTALADREAYGALLPTPQGPPGVLVASAASPAVAQLLTQVASGLGGPGGVQVVDAFPAPVDDPRGAGLAAGVLPLALGGVASAVLLALTVTGLGRRLIAAAAISLLAGPALVGVLHGVLGSLAGDAVTEAAVVSLALAGTLLGLLGLHALLGRAGVAVGALTVVLLGNPLSAAASAPELLPAGWSQLGQVLPPGAAVAALRAVSGFDGAGALEPVLVLASWAVGGLALAGLATALGSTRGGGVAPVTGRARADVGGGRVLAG